MILETLRIVESLEALEILDSRVLFAKKDKSGESEDLQKSMLL